MDDHKKARQELLLKMYDQMFNDINRHILVVWQSIGVLAGAITILALVEKQVVPLDIAVALIVLVGFWSCCHLEDASYWYNRNLVIIANIERQFLDHDDLKRVHYYFGAHRPKNRMIMHILIQYVFGVGIVFIVLGYHFLERVLPGWPAPWKNCEPMCALPYATSVLLIGFLIWLKRNRRSAYDEFLENSPGDAIHTAGVRFGVGHGHSKRDAEQLQQAAAGADPLPTPATEQADVSEPE